VFVALLVAPQAVLAHGVGGRPDLPVELWQVAWAASLAVAASFVAFGSFWQKPRLRAASVGRVLPRAFQRVATAVVPLLRIVGVVMLAVVIGAGLWGNTNPSVNIAPVTIYIIFWVGLQVISALFGDVWRAANPLATLEDTAAWLRCRIKREAAVLNSVGETSAQTRNVRIGNEWWAVAAIFAFVWFELAYHDNSEPRTLGVFLAAYVAVMLAGASIAGREWLRHADGFGVLFSKFAAMAPLHRSGGKLHVRAPLAGLVALAVKPGSAAFVLVVLGSTTFDGFSRSTFWLDVTALRSGWELTVINTFGLLFVIGCVYVLYRAATSVMAALTGDSEHELGSTFVASLIPIAAAYTVAHYFSYLLFEGQQIIALVSDPFGRGWDIFGTATYRVNYTLLSTSAISWTQTAAIAAGHILGVAVAHDLAVERWPRHIAIRSQYPLLAAMIAYTVIGLTLLLGA